MTRTRSRSTLSPRLCGAVAATVLFVVHAGSAPELGAEPRFAVREGVTCATCHVNPSGAGLRNDYGRYVYAATQLPSGYPADGAVRELLDVDLGDSIDIGTDARMMVLEQFPTDDSTEGLSTFFQMQADLYLAATLLDGLTIYYDQSLLGSFEAFGMYRFDFGNPVFAAYLKMGRYVPPYGLRLPNHNVFTRDEIGFGPRDKDTGLELGFELGPLLVQGSVSNGAGSERLLDDNAEVAWMGRAELIGRLGALRLMLGGSVYSNTTGTRTEFVGVVTDTRTDTLRAGGHWGMNLGRFTVLGEVDVVDVEASEDSLDAANNSLRAYNSAFIRLFRGLELIAGHEYRDADLDLKTGTAHRLTGGLDWFPVAQIQLTTLYRHILGAGRDEGLNDGFQEFLGIVHFYY